MKPAASPRRPPGRPAGLFAGQATPCKRFIQVAVLACAAGVGTLLPLGADLRTALAVVAIGACVPMAAMAWALRRQWPATPDPAYRGVAWLGAMFIVAAIAFDIAATLHHSPTLEYEANPIALALLDSGTPLPWVLGLAGVAQCAVCLTLCLLWFNFSVRRQDYLAWLAGNHADVPLWMRLFGARTPSLFNLSLGRDCEPGVQVMVFGPFALGAAAYRLWLGLEWFGWVPMSRVWMPALCLGGTFALLWRWAHRNLRDAHVPAA